MAVAPALLTGLFEPAALVPASAALVPALLVVPVLPSVPPAPPDVPALPPPPALLSPPCASAPPVPPLLPPPPVTVPLVGSQILSGVVDTAPATGQPSLPQDSSFSPRTEPPVSG